MSKELKTKIGQQVANDPVEAYLRTEFGIDNVMQYEFDDLTTKEHHDFVLDSVRGNVQLRRGIFRTFQDSKEIFDRVLKLDFKSLLHYKR